MNYFPGELVSPVDINTNNILHYEKLFIKKFNIQNFQQRISWFSHR